jgi:pyruvate/2-oxoglutarate dehydrogenase complex dihydrolipoamide dehydrogenase (E3) component
MAEMTTRPRTFDRNLLVIGAGSAGLVCAVMAAQLGARVTLVERHEMGGDCLNTGCVPSKALIHAARLMHSAREAAALGLIPPPPAPDTRAAFAHVRTAIRAIAPHDSVERMTTLGIDVRLGHARILSRWAVAIGDETLTTRAVVIATGASPQVPPIPGLEDTGYLTSDTLWQLDEAPRRLLIVGGGPMGCELSQAFARLGSEVTLVQHRSCLLPREDEDASALVQQCLEAAGVRVLTSHQATEARLVDNERRVRLGLVDGPGINELDLRCDRVLVAVGRRPRTEGLGLEDVGVALAENGTIAISPYLETSVPGIYACGDVAGPWQLTHAAGHQGWQAAVNALFSPLHRTRFDRAAMPVVTYTSPEVARVGKTEHQLRAEGLASELTRRELASLDRAIVDNARAGFVKILTERGRDRIIGATIVAPRAGEMIAEVVLAMDRGLGLKHLLSSIHAYPTYGEAVRSASSAWRREHAPAWALGLLRGFHRWRRG